jgi:hypothetical protein
MIAVVLWVLATLDAGFTGYREAAGRNALINKRLYYRRAMFKGALFGQVAVGIAAVVVLVSLAVTPDRESLMRGYNKAGARMLIFYLPYAAVIVLALLLRWIPSVDIRSITSTLIFGPFTLLRPVVAIVGLIYGVIGAPRVATVLTGLIVLTMMLSLEKVLSLFRRFGGDWQGYDATS